MLLQWGQERPPLKLQWEGPNKITSAVSTMQEVQTKLAVISGPRGRDGEKGEPGTVGGLPATLDGGFF